MRLIKDSNDNLKAVAVGILILLIALLSSCMVNRKGELTERGKNFVANHCNGKDSTVENHEIIFKDTTIYVTQKGDPILIPSPCDSLKPINIVKKKNGLKSTVKTVGKDIIFECEADSLKAVIKTLERRKSIIRVKVAIVEKPCIKAHINGFYWFLIWAGGLCLAYLLIKLIFKAFKAYLSGGLSGFKFW